MANLLEILVTCDSNNPLATCTIWDPNTGTNLMTYKGGGTAEARTLSFISNDYLAVVEKTKPILHIWPLNSQQTVQGMRFILPGKANTFSVTQDGNYCIAGIDEKIYLWQISSGNLLTIITRHYQKVNLLKFTPDGRFFVSAAEDGMLMVWSLATVAAHPEVELVTQSTAGQHDPVYMFSDHSLPITDLCLSKTGMHGRLCTVSSDRTCKIYDLTSGEMLLNLVFDHALSAVTMDVLELNIFVGTAEGKIYEFSLTNPPRTRDVLVSSSDNTPVFTSHTKAVTCLSVSINGDILMSGSNDQRVILWHIKSKQPVRTIMHKGNITNAFFTLNFDTIFKQQFNPCVILHSLERTLEKDNDEVVEIEVLINKKINFWPQNIKTDSDNSLQSKYVEVEFKQKEKALHEELNNLKTINTNLYEYSMKNILNAAVTNVNNTSNKKKMKK